MLKEEKTIASVNTNKYMLNKDKIYVELNSNNKMKWLQTALKENKIFILTKTGMKTNVGIKCENAPVTQMYLFREMAIEYANANGFELDVFETYKDDIFTYEASLVISKKTI